MKVTNFVTPVKLHWRKFKGTDYRYKKRT